MICIKRKMLIFLFWFLLLILIAFLSRFSIVDMPDMDVFGSTNTKKAVDCTCPNCDRPVASSRFAPHLEKCMGMKANWMKKRKFTRYILTES